jgi:CxxC motif-containing protein (DUF1111 family)
MRAQIYLTAFFLLAFAINSAFSQDITNLGGDLTTDITGANAIQVAAPNTTSTERHERQISGFAVFHKIFAASEGLGPNFVNSSCGGCHVGNGKGPVGISTSSIKESAMVIKVSLSGKDSTTGAPKPLPGVGGQIQERSTDGELSYKVRLRWIPVKGKYPDGTPYTLRSPKLTFDIPGIQGRKIKYSLRMTPALIGLGLLETIPEETILSYVDKHDSDKDGVKGKPQYAYDIRTAQKKLGRFGFKGGNTTVEQQTGGAAFNDIGITNALFQDGSSNGSEMTDDDFDRLVLYQRIPGVPAARNQGDSKVIAGKALFQKIGCDSCHRVTVKTGTSDAPELENQTIHPFTDLLLHNMGKELADNRTEFSARPSEWRTTPLWGLGFASTISNVRIKYLHDGRARTITEAILWHNGEAKKSRMNFMTLTKEERSQLIAFLKSL